jgi:hypothetical protein
MEICRPSHDTHPALGDLLDEFEIPSIEVEIR